MGPSCPSQPRSTPRWSHAAHTSPKPMGNIAHYKAPHQNKQNTSENEHIQHFALCVCVCQIPHESTRSPTWAEVVPKQGQLAPKLRHVGSKLGPSWSQVRPSWAQVGTILPQAGPNSSPCWGPVELLARNNEFRWCCPDTSSTRAGRGAEVSKETSIAYRVEQRLCPYRVRASLLCFTAAIFWLFIPAPSLLKDLFSFRLISSHCSFSWKLLIASHCHCGLCHPSSSHLMSCLLVFFISSQFISCLPSFSQLFSADHNCSHLFSCQLSFSHLFSAHVNSPVFSSSQPLHSTQLVSTQLITALLVSGRLNSPHLISSRLISALLTTLLSSSQIMSSHLPSSSHAHLSSSHLISAFLSSHSDHLSSSPRQSHKKYGFELKPF